MVLPKIIIAQTFKNTLSRILLLAATTGYQIRSLAAAAASLKVDVLFATNRCHILEDPWSDHAIPIRFDEPRESAAVLIEAARGRGIDGIAAVADAPTTVAALTAQALGIPWHPPDATLLCRDKHAMRERFDSAGLPVPRHARIEPGSGALPPGLQYPCVLKPLHLSASRGVIRVDSPEEFAAALTRIRVILNDRQAPVQAEEYVEGREFALEGLMSHGELKTLAIFDKPDPLTGPFFEETIYITPSREAGDVQEAIVAATRRAVKALGLWHGPIHAEMRVNQAGVWMLEIAARPIGGLCSRALRFSVPNEGGSISLEQLVVLHAIGKMPRNFAPAAPASGVMMVPVPRAGIFASVSGADAARAVPGIEDVVITVKPGEKLIPLPEGSSYTGFLFASGAKPAAVENALREAHAKLHFEMLADLPVLP
ncbi:MAG: ATP-grasp domain-containing protein [Terriglobia bacterium]